MMFYPDIHQFFFFLFETFITFTKPGLEFGLKEIFIIWGFSDKIKHSILNVFWWELVWLHVLFPLELDQLFFFCIKILITYSKLGLGFCLKVIFRGWSFRGEESNHFASNVFWREHVWFFFWEFGILWETHCFLFWIQIINFWMFIFFQMLQFSL